MSYIKNEIKLIRYMPSLCALVSPEERMGVPRFLQDGVLYIPFFHIEDGKYALSAKVYAEYPKVRLIGYKKIRNRIYSDIPARQLSSLMKTAESGGFVYSDGDIPAELKYIYQTEGEF